MTRKTNKYQQQKKHEKILLVVLLLVIAVLVCLLLYQHFSEKESGGSSAPSGNTGVNASSTPVKDPVWHENSAPAKDTSVGYTPPADVTDL